jgi:hypothetical protein
VQYLSPTIDAVAITAGNTVTGNLNWAGDAGDIYSILVNKDDVVTLTMTASTGDFDLYLYNSDENEVASSDGGTSNEQIEFTITQTGTYYIYCWAADGSGQYTLEVGVQGPGLFQQTWFWMLLAIIIVVMVVIVVAVKLATRPKEGDEMFGAPAAQPPSPAPIPQEQPTKEEAKQVYCENCQKLIPADGVICPYCGKNPFEPPYD